MFTTIVISTPANTTPKNQIIDHFTTSFHFLSFSSSPPLKTSSSEPYTIEPTARIARTHQRVCIQDCITSLNQRETFKLSNCQSLLVVTKLDFVFSHSKQSWSAHCIASPSLKSHAEKDWFTIEKLRETRNNHKIISIFFIILFIY